MATQSVKDILNTEVPKPSFVLSPSVPAPLPSGVTVTRNGGDNVARTLDPYSGKFEHVPEDTPRVYGDDQSLLVEAAERTNKILYSTVFDDSVWDSTFTNVVSANNESVIDGETAVLVEESRGAGGARVQGELTFSGGQETLTWIAERDTAPKIRLDITNNDLSDEVARADYDFNADSFEIKRGSVRQVNSRTLTENGPNGGKVVRLFMRVGPNDGAGYSFRDGQRITLGCDVNTNSNRTYYHHAQLEEAPNASSPIVTSGSAKTRAGGNYTIFDYSNDPDQEHPDYWNPNQGTYLLNITPRTFEVYNPEGNQCVLSYGSKFNGLILQNGSNGEKNFQFFDGNTLITEGTTNPFENNSVAISFTDSQLVLSVDGSSSSGSYNGDFVNTSRIDIAASTDRLIATIKKLEYRPRALPESTLNILTS